MNKYDDLPLLLNIQYKIKHNNTISNVIEITQNLNIKQKESLLNLYNTQIINLNLEFNNYKNKILKIKNTL